MMEQLAVLMALPARVSFSWAGRLLAALSAGLLLNGCTPRWQLPTVIYIAVGVSNDQAIDSDLLKDFKSKLEALESGFKSLYPNTSFQFSLYPEDQLVEATELRNRQGLGPDLFLVNGETATQLLKKRLTEPFPATPLQLHAFEPSDLKRLRTSTGQLVGLPILLQTQVSCFNRKRLPEAPATVQDLLAVSADGVPIGLPSTITNLFWTAGSLGGLAGFDRALSGAKPNAEELAGIEHWLAWLQDASYQQRVIFYADQQAAENQLIAGQLDWIPCRSTVLPRLRNKMGNSLGVAALPNGEFTEASPVNRLRLIALGRNSSAAGRKRALAFSRFSINPLTQRNITLGSQVYLPANRFVRIPVLSSSVLAAMVTASEQGRQSNQAVNQLHGRDRRLLGLQNLTNELVFGEVTPKSAAIQLVRILREKR